MTTDTTDSGSLHRDAQGKGPKEKGPRDNRWYFRLMAPNTKGDKFAWLDPTSIYINGAAFTDLLDDLCACLLYTSPSPRDQRGSRMPSSA